MRLIAIERHELGPRCRILGWRCHHYHVGVALVVLGLELVRRDLADVRLAVVAGVALAGEFRGRAVRALPWRGSATPARWS